MNVIFCRFLFNLPEYYFTKHPEHRRFLFLCPQWMTYCSSFTSSITTVISSAPTFCFADSLE